MGSIKYRETVAELKANDNHDGREDKGDYVHYLGDNVEISCWGSHHFAH